MNNSDSAIPVEPGIERILSTVEDYVRREPLKASAVAFGAGLLLKLLPARAVARPVATLAVKLLPPALVGLGLLKALEICCQHEPPAAGSGEGRSPGDGPGAAGAAGTADQPNRDVR